MPTPSTPPTPPAPADDDDDDAGGGWEDIDLSLRQYGHVAFDGERLAHFSQQVL